MLKVHNDMPVVPVKTPTETKDIQGLLCSTVEAKNLSPEELQVSGAYMYLCQLQAKTNCSKCQSLCGTYECKFYKIPVSKRIQIVQNVSVSVAQGIQIVQNASVFVAQMNTNCTKYQYFCGTNEYNLCKIPVSLWYK